MPVVTFRERETQLYCYIAKQDLEARVLAVEHDSEGKWGGTIHLEGGRQYVVSVQPGKPVFPLSLRASRDIVK
nr:putative nitrogen fixation protein NifT [uncultured Enterobacter sp.]